MKIRIFAKFGMLYFIPTGVFFWCELLPKFVVKKVRCAVMK